MAEREKSALYPGVTWSECVDLINKISSFNLKAVSYQALAEKYGLTSTTTKSFTTRIGAAKQFGLITTAQGTVQLTENSRQILYPTGDTTRAIELECFSLPPLYAKLIAKYDGIALPSETILANILMNEHRISRAAKDCASKCFVESAEQLGILKGGVLCYSEVKNGESASETVIKTGPVQENERGQDDSERIDQQVSPIMATSESNFISQSIPFESGKVARFIIPVDATEDDLLLLRDMFDVLLKRKFKIDI